MNIDVEQTVEGFRAVIFSDSGGVIDRLPACPTRCAAVVAGVQSHPRAVCCSAADEDSIAQIAMWVLLTASEREDVLAQRLKQSQAQAVKRG